jgi:hypothetical protein
MTLYQNPTTYGKTREVEAWRIITCPTCARPAASIVDQPGRAPRTVRAICDQGHQWWVSWSGKSTILRRHPVEQGT